MADRSLLAVEVDKDKLVVLKGTRVKCRLLRVNGMFLTTSVSLANRTRLTGHTPDGHGIYAIYLDDTGSDKSKEIEMLV